MAEMKQIFGSDSENEDQNEKQESIENNQADENQREDEEDDALANDNQDDDEENENQENAADGDGDGDGDDDNDNNDANDEDDDDDVVKPKTDKKTAEVFGDELADLSDDSDANNDEEDEEDENRKSSQHVEEAEEEQEPEQVIDIEIPRVKTDLGAEIQFVKLPNFLSVEPKPFDPDTYEDENLMTDSLDEEGKTRVRLKVENTMRWRYEKDEEGNLVKQSNSKIVRWSDGSLSLHIGNEIFDVHKLALNSDHNHLFVRQGNVLQGQAVFRTKLAFRPHSIDSMTHRKMTMSLVDHGSRTKKVKILAEINKNPEHNRLEMLKKEEEKLRAAARRQNQQRRLREKSHQKGLSANYLEDRYYSDEEDTSISLSAIKSKFKNRNDSRTSIYSSSSDESDRERRLNRAKNHDGDDDNDDNDANDHDRSQSGDDDDDDLDGRRAHSSSRDKKKKKMKKVVSDDDDDE